MKTKGSSTGHFIFRERYVFGADPRDSPLQLKALPLLVLNPYIFLCPYFRKTSYSADVMGHNLQGLKQVRAQQAQQQREEQTQTDSVLLRAWAMAATASQGDEDWAQEWEPAALWTRLSQGRKHCIGLRCPLTLSICTWRIMDTNYTSLWSEAVWSMYQRVKFLFLFILFLGFGQSGSNQILVT